MQVIDPRFGETVLDPASGTGGFLVEAFNHLSKQVKTVADRKRLQSESIFGCEPKSLPYLLGQMNLLLHGLDAPQIDPGNSLRFKLSEIGEKERVDVILTNPPFGGEEEKGIQGNFPEDRQTAETALLFLQLIMRRLRRHSTPAGKPARAAVVVPESVMADTGVAQRIRRQLIEEMNLHTVIRLPKGVFEPYSDIQTNILFFDTSKPTRGIWYYQHEVPAARKTMRDPKYTVTSPLTYEDLRPALEWVKSKKSSSCAWFIDHDELTDKQFTLDFRNPSRTNRSVVSFTDLSLSARDCIHNTSGSLSKLLSSSKEIEMLTHSSWEKCLLRDILERVRIEAAVEQETLYKQITGLYPVRLTPA